MSILVIETDAQRFVFVCLLLFVPSIINIQVIFEWMNEWMNTILPIISYCDFYSCHQEKKMFTYLRWQDHIWIDLWNDLHFLKKKIVEHSHFKIEITTP